MKLFIDNALLLSECAEHLPHLECSFDLDKFLPKFAYTMEQANALPLSC
jgi:hypothetical protein